MNSNKEHNGKSKLHDWKVHMRIVFIICLCVSIFVATKGLGLDTAPPSTRMQYHAMPVAISVLKYGWQHDYTASWQVAMAFQNPNFGSFADKLAMVQSPDFKISPSLYYWNADDRGLADFAILAGALFGPNLVGLFYFYFTLFGVIVATFLLGHYQSARAITFLSILLAAFLGSLPLWVSAPMAYGFGEASIHISESRLFGLLSLLPLAHIFLFSIQRDAAKRRQIFALVIQLGVFVFLLHARSSIMWQVGGLLAIISGNILTHFLSDRKVDKKKIHVIAGVLIAVFAILPLYKLGTYNSHYLTKLDSRTVWHNMLMGLAGSPVLGPKLQVNGDDKSAIRAVVKYTKETVHRDNPDFSIDDVTQDALNSLGSHVAYDWAAHESVARTVFFNQLKEEPMEFLKLFFYYKPQTVYSITKSHFLTLVPHQQKEGEMVGTGALAPPLLLIGFVVIFVAGVFSRLLMLHPINHNEDEKSLYLIVAYSVVLSIFALAPPIIFYPSITTVAAFLMCVVVVTLIIAYKLGVYLSETIIRRSF